MEEGGPVCGSCEEILEEGDGGKEVCGRRGGGSKDGDGGGVLTERVYEGEGDGPAVDFEREEKRSREIWKSAR